MKLRALALLSIIVLLTVTTSLTSSTVSGSQELIDTPIVSGFAPNEYLAVDGFGIGWGPFTETNDYTDTFYYGGDSYYVSDALTIRMVLVFQLPVLSFEYYDSIVFNAEWRFTASASATGYWSLGNSTGGFVGAHNNLYSYTGTDSGYENVTTSLDIDIDVITAQNSTGHLSFIMSGAGAGTYGVYCDRAFLSVEYEDDFAYQTVEGDTYLTPDPTQFLATYGSYGKGFGEFVETNDYTETWTNDGTYWKIADTLTLRMNMMVQLPDVSKFDRIIFHADWRYESDVSDTGYWALGNSTGGIVGAHNNLYSYTGTDSGFEEIEIALNIDADVITAQNSTGYLSFILTTAGINDYEIYCDFAFVSLERDYVESFSDVSNWSAGGGTWTLEDGETFSSNGDILSYDGINDGGNNDYDGIYYNISLSNPLEYVIEISAKLDALPIDQFRVYLWENASATGDYYFFNLGESTTYQTYNIRIADLSTSGTPTSIESIGIMLKSDIGQGPFVANVDYLGVGKPDEMGLSHDGSNTENIYTSGATSVSSDSDLLNISATSATHYAEVFVDGTSTEAKISTADYPFLSWKVDALHDDDGDDLVYLVRAYEDAGTYKSLYSYSLENGTFYANIAVDLDYLWKVRIYIRDANEWVQFDYIQAYSIANWTITQSGCGVDDYLYVSQGILYSNMDDGSITVNYEPTFLLNGSYSWNKSTSLGESYLSYNHGGWTSYSGNTAGDLVGGPAITDLRIKFNETANVIDIQYSSIPPQWHSFTFEQIQFDMPNWHSFTFGDIIFYLPINVLTLSYYLMLGGLVLIPTSTILLVKGGREEMSRDKLYLFLIMFLMGWALFLGGVL